MDQSYSSIKECRSCGGSHIVDILDLGAQPLANSLGKSASAQAQRFPLTLAFCQDCRLVQLRETVKKEILFDQYVWVTGTSMAAKEYSQTFCQRTMARTGLKPGDLIVEIASNDGTILKQFITQGCRVLGVEPAKNIAALAEQAGVATFNGYWNKETAAAVKNKYGEPKVIAARNVVPHVSELHAVIEGIAACLAEDGTGVIEFHDGGTIARELHYDSIYHEHLCYFTAHSMSRLLEAHGLFGFHIDHSPISGGSYVLYCAKQKRTPTDAYTQVLLNESNEKINELSTWETFARRSRDHRAKTQMLLKDLGGKNIVGFGASARSATYLNFCEITHKDLRAVIDNNPLKQNLFTPGSNVPIVSLAQGMALKPDVIFILAWNFAEEIMDECVRQGFNGQFLAGFPQVPRFLERSSALH